MRISEVIVRRLSDKRYRTPITNIIVFIDGVSFCQRIEPKDCELVEVTHHRTPIGFIEPVELTEYDSIVEALATASSLGYFLRHFNIEGGTLFMSIEKNYNIDNLTPDLIDSIANKIVENRNKKHELEKMLFGDTVGMP